MKRRLLVSFLLFLAILSLPYWIYLPLLLAAMVLLPGYWESVLFGFLIDVLYGSSGTLRLLSPTALAVLAILLALMPVKERLRWKI